MADAVTTQTIFDTKTRIKVHWTNISDGTGELAVKKLDISTLSASDGAAPASLDIESVRWNIQGMTSVRILWDHTTDDVAVVLFGSGYDDFRNDDQADDSTIPALRDPRSSGGDGSILLTTNGQVSGASYDITVTLRKRPD